MNYWTEQEIQYLRDNYTSKGIDFCSTKLKRSRKSIKDKAYQLKITKKKRNKYVESEIIQILENKRLKLLSKFTKTMNKHKIQCYCGSEFQCRISSIVKNQVKSCGCLQKIQASNASFKDLTGCKFGDLTVICFSEVRKQQRYWKCLCSCGKEAHVSTCSLKNHNTRSCGCLRLKNLNKNWSWKLTNCKQIYGKLTAIQPIGTKNGSIWWQCLCECGNYTILKSDHFAKERIKTCGKCGLFRNKKKTSYPALKLHELLIENNLRTNHKLHNYNTKSKSNIDIAVIYNNQKIAIEYDSKRYHFSKRNRSRDLIKTKTLIQNGWKVLRIRSNGQLPKFKTIKKKLDKFKYTNYQVITMKDWYEKN